jgi:hypothetical protein
MKRFKTKQEFIREYGKPHNWAIAMNPLFGVPFKGSAHYGWAINDEHLTTAPHPYAGKSFVVKCLEPEDSRRVQEKAFEMGMEWNSGETVVCYADARFLFFDWNSENKNHVLTYGDQLLMGTTPVILTDDEFMEGYWPGYSDSLCQTKKVEVNPQKMQKREIQYKKWDQVTFNLPGETITYKVLGHESKCFLSRAGANDYIFTKLGIDKFNFIRSILGRKSASGSFPYCESLEELTKVIYALKEECIARCHADQMEFVVSSEPSWSIDTGKFESILFTPYSPSKQTENGRSIKVQRQAPAIRSGQSPKGSRVSGKASHASTRRGFIGYRAVSCRE